MVRKLGKKGLSHADWAISLMIFMIFIFWFFLIIRPVVSPAEDPTTLFDVVQDGIESDFFMDYEIIPIFISEDHDSQYEPAFFTFDRNWSAENLYIPDHYLELYGGKLFFLANLSAQDEFLLYHSDQKYFQTSKATLISNQNGAQLGSFQAVFEDSLLDHISFQRKYRLEDFEVYVDEVLFDGETDYVTEKIFANYNVVDQINHSALVFAENTRVYTFVEPIDYQAHNITITALLYNYTYYRVNNSFTTSPDYTFGTCKTHTTNSVDFSDGESGLFFYFSSPAEIEVCPFNQSIEFSAKFEVSTDEQENYQIYLHEGDYTEIQELPIEPIQGIDQSIIALSQAELLNFNQTPYDNTKNDWNFPQDHEFRLTLESSVLNFTYGSDSPENTDVYVKKINTYLFDNQMNKVAALFKIAVW